MPRRSCCGRLHGALILGTALSLSFVSAQALAQQESCKKIVISDDSDYGPMHWYDGKKLTGVSIDVVTAALSAMQIPYEVRFMGPLQSVLEAAKRGELDMIASLKETPARREYLAFTKEAVFANPVAVFVARDRTFTYTKWSDLIGKKGGISQANQFGDGFDEFIEKNLVVEVEKKTYMNFTKVDMGRIDYLITGYYSGLAYLKQSGQQDRFVALKPFVSDAQSMVAISKRSPCLKYLPALDKQLAIMRQQGQLNAILERNLAAF